jgi:DNA adenine methylase
LRANKQQKEILNYINNDNSQNILLAHKRKENKKNKTIIGVPHPFLKWAGGKRQLLGQIEENLPKKFDKYIEPFVGGGALFFYLLPERAVLIDTNNELVNTYLIIKNRVKDLIKSLKKHKNEKDYYYEVRNIDRNYEEYQKFSNVEKASRTIFLNRCCYNGLYRVNSKGQFNVPFGKYKNPKFCDEENLLAVNRVLQQAEIIAGDFEKCLEFAKLNDFVYFDPPYQPISETANFTSYTKENFSKEDQLKLFKTYQKLDERGCKVMLSNSYNDFIMNLYQQYKIKYVSAKRAINSDANGRGEIRELLIINY